MVQGLKIRNFPKVTRKDPVTASRNLQEVILRTSPASKLSKGMTFLCQLLLKIVFQLIYISVVNNVKYVL